MGRSGVKSAGSDEESRGFHKGDWRLITRFIGYLRPHAGGLLFAIFAMGISSGAQVLGPYLMSLGIDRHILPGHLEGLWKIAVCYVAVLVAVFAGTYIQTSSIGRIGQSVCLTLRDRLYARIHRLPFRFFDKNPVGRTVTRVTNDVEALSELVASGVVAILSDVVLLTGIAIAMFWMNPNLAALSFLFLPILGVLTWGFRKRVRESFRDIRLKLARLNSFLNERVQGMRVIRAFTAESETADRHSAINADHYESHMDSIRLFSIYNPLVDFVGRLSIAVLILFAAGKILDGNLTLGELVAFLVYLEMFYKPIQDLAEKYNILQAALAAMEKVFGLLDEPEDDCGTGTGRAPHSAAVRGHIAFERAHFTYDREEVLHDVSFEVRPGERVALVGPTGAGKSTLASLLLGFYAPASGAVRIDGRPVREYSLPNLRRRIGYVTQEPFLFSGTLGENISLGDPAISESAIRRAAEICGLMGLTRRFPAGLASPLTERGSTLSAGERQLIAFARCLAFDPAILLLDEATAAIDPATERWLSRAMTAAASGRTSILIAHRLETIRFCDRIVVLQRGSVAETGTHEELILRDGLYAALYRIQEAA